MTRNCVNFAASAVLLLKYHRTIVKMMYACLFIMMLALPYILMNVVFYQQELTFRPLVAMSTLLFLAFAGYLAFYFYVDWKF